MSRSINTVLDFLHSDERFSVTEHEGQFYFMRECNYSFANNESDYHTLLNYAVSETQAQAVAIACKEFSDWLDCFEADYDPLDIEPITHMKASI
jgi:hypothetical protein